LVRAAVGLMQWMSPALLFLKMPVHALSRTNQAPNAGGLRLCYKLALICLERIHWGLAFSRSTDLTGPVVSGAYKYVRRNFAMAAGAPSVATVASDATWSHVMDKSTETSVFTHAGAAVDVMVRSIPGQPMSSGHGETWAQSSSMARGIYVINVLVALDCSPDDPVAHMGDNDSTIQLSNDEATSKNSHYYLRRANFARSLQRDEVYNPIKVDTKENPADFLGKLVEASKLMKSLEYCMGLSRAPSRSAVLSEAGRRVPIPGLVDAVRGSGG
jgi:hypothetical protein